MIYKVKTKTYKSYNAAVNWAIAKKAPITNENGKNVPILCVGELVEFNNECYMVCDINANGVVLYGIGHKVGVYGENLLDIDCSDSEV